MNAQGKMDNSVKITLIISVVVISLVLIGILVYFQIKPGQTVSSLGIAVVKATPDLVSVYFNVDTEGETSKEANDKNAEIVDDAITSLVKLGFERKEITTENFNIYPEYNWRSGTQEITGYRATHTLKVKFSTDKTDKIGDAIDAGVNAGAGISYINFELSQELQNQYKAEALQKATEDARVKAGGIAEGLGKSLGRVVSVSSSEFGYYPWPIYRNDMGGVTATSEAKAATTNIQPGEQEISGQVSVVFALR